MRFQLDKAKIGNKNRANSGHQRLLVQGYHGNPKGKKKGVLLLTSTFVMEFTLHLTEKRS